MVDIAAIPGDGIGKEIIPQVCDLLSSIDPSVNFTFYISSGVPILPSMADDATIDGFAKYTLEVLSPIRPIIFAARSGYSFSMKCGASLSGSDVLRYFAGNRSKDRSYRIW